MRVNARMQGLAAVLVLAGFVWTASAQTPPAPTTVPSAAAPTTAPAEPTSAFDDFVKRTKEPLPWFKWGADERARVVYNNNITYLDKERPGHEQFYEESRARLWATASVTPDIDVNVRLVWLFKNFCQPEGIPAGVRDTDLGEVVVDNLNVKWRNTFGLPATLTVGRQDIILGDGWLVLDGTPLDASRTIYFDAVRLNYEFKSIQSMLDLIYIDQSGDEIRWIEPFNHRNFQNVIEQKERGAIAYFTNKSIKRTEWNAYLIYKNDTPEFANGQDADIYTMGARVAGSMDEEEHWRYRAELAKQLGHRNGNDVCALGFNSRLSYFFKDPLNNNVRMSYEYRSGDRPGTKTDEGFDSVWGRWPQFSELYVYTVARERRIADMTNLHRVGPGWSFNPTKQLEVCADYYLLFAEANSYASRPGFSSGGNFRGQLATLLLRYKFTPNISGHLIGEAFFPGNYYNDSSNDVATFLRYEIMFTW